MSVQIAQYKGRSWLSKTIRFFTRGDYSHSCFWLDNKTCVEAWTSGLRMVGSLSANHTKRTIVDIYDLKPPLTKKQEKKLIELINNDLENPPKYDFLHVLTFISLVRLLIGKDRNGDNKFFCVEYVIQRLLDVGYKLLNCDPYKISPNDIVKSTKLKLVKTIITR